jgi:hypothetical protein
MGLGCALMGHIWTKVAPGKWICFECGKKVSA